MAKKKKKAMKMAEEMDEQAKSDEQAKAQESAIRKLKIKKAVKKVKEKEPQQDAVERSRRVRRAAWELFTEAKAKGEIPKDMKFEDFPESKFFKGRKRINPAEKKRKKFKEEMRGVKKRGKGPLER